ncbi:MAG: membrane fusion protein (multidrug efflux system) [Paraglaciecola sp.]|jgi:membrane fusion protein (multidrug efflux system)
MEKLRKRDVSWKVVKSLFAVLVIFALCWFVWSKLNSNKAKMNETSRLAAQINDVFPVEVAIAGEALLEEGVGVYGKLMPGKMAYLLADAIGKVTKLYKRKGEKVRKGEVIAKVEDATLQSKRRLAQANLDKLQLDRQRVANLVAGDAATVRQLEQVDLGIKTAEDAITMINEALKNTNLKAPVTGEISEIFTEEGMLVGGGAKVAEIISTTELKMLARVSEEVVIRLKEGQKVNLKIDVFPKMTFPGVVNLVSAKGDFGGKYQIEIEITDKKGRELRTGMYATVEFLEGEKTALMIPRKAIIGSIQSPEVYVVKDSTATLRKLEIGSYDSDRVEVLVGLKVGEQVVLSGQINLREGVKVEVRQ